jgi:broad specificity phosphatase PhoE
MLGRTDPPLSDFGRQQMRELHLPVRLVFTSPLQRALESATLMARGAEVVVLPELAEIALGTWDGKSWEQIEASDPELARRKLENWTAVTPPDGEPWWVFSERVGRAMDAVRTRGESAAVVAHIAVNASIAALLTGADPLHFRQDYGQIYEYDV